METRQLLAADLLLTDPAPMQLEKIEQTFESDGETDQVALFLDLGDMLLADLDTTGGEFRDSMIEIRNSQGVLVAENDDARDPTTQESSSDPAIMYVSEASDTYTLSIIAKPSDNPVVGTTEYDLNVRNYTLHDGVAQPMTQEIADGDTMAWLVGDELFLSDMAGNGFKLQGAWEKTITVDEHGIPSASYTNRGPITLAVADPVMGRSLDDTTPAPAVGDSNGDGVFDSSDLIQVFAAGKYGNDQVATFAEGDWNSDGFFDSADLILAFASGSFENASSALVGVKTTDALPAGADMARLSADKVPDQQDVLRAFLAGKYESSALSTFAEGDWNLDGRFDSSDLIYIYRHDARPFNPHAALGRLDLPPSEAIGQRGLFGEYYALNFFPAQLDEIDFDALLPTHKRVDSTVDFSPTTSSFGGLNGPALLDNFAARWTGQIYIDTPGEYLFVGGSDDGSRVFINDRMVDNNDGLHGFRENLTYQDAIRASQPLHWYRFDEDESVPLRPDGSRNAIDSGVGQNASYVGVDQIDGLIDGAARFADPSDIVSIDAFGAPVSGAWTAEFVLQDFGNSPGPSDHLLEDGQFALKLDQFNNTGQLGYTRFGVADFRFNPPVTIPRGEYVHVAFVGNPTSGVQVFVNGNFAGSNPNYIAMPRGRIGSPNVNINAAIDEVVLYSRALPQAELQDHVNSIFGSTGSEPITLSKGFHDIRMEYFERGGAAGARLRWLRPDSSVREVVPSEVLIPYTADGGLFGEFFQLDTAPQSFDQIEFENLSPAHTRVDRVIDFPATQDAFAGLGNPALFDQFAARWTGQLYVDQPGEYTFFVNADDEGRLTIDGTPLTLNAGVSGPTVASQSSEFAFASFPASNALDGDFSNFTHTNSFDTNATWQATLSDEQIIDQVVLHNRQSCCSERLRDLTVQILDSNSNVVFTSPLINPSNVLGSPASITIPIPDVLGRTIVVSRENGSGLGSADDLNVLSLGEVQISSRSFARATVTLSEGFHDLSLDFFDSTGPAGIELTWRAPGQSSAAAIPASQLIPDNLENGLFGEYYQLDFSPTSLDAIDFSGLTPELAQVDATIDVPSFAFVDDFAVRWSGYVFIDEPGDYQFIAGSGDGSRVYVNDVLIVDNDGLHDFSEVASEPIRLNRGLNLLRMEYFEDSDGDGAQLSWIEPGNTAATIIPTESLYHRADSAEGIDEPEVGDIVLDGTITVSTAAGVFGNLAGAVNQMTSETQFSVGVDPFLNYYTDEYGLNITTPGRSFGIGLGRDLGFLFAPLRDSGVYIWARESTGASVAFGGAVVSSGNSQTVTTILDPADPFIYSEAGDFRLGISHQGLIPFTPRDRDAQFEEADLDINGHIYARIDGIEIPNIPATLRGEMVVDLEANDPVARIPDIGIEGVEGIVLEGLIAGIVPNVAVGFNGEVRVALPEEYTGGVFTASIPIGGATLQYEDFLGGFAGAGEAGIALSGGTINPLLGTPFENAFVGTGGFGIPNQWQFQFSASGETPLDFARSFRIDAALQSGAGTDGIGIDIPSVGEITLGAPGERLDISITPESAAITAGVASFLGSAELQGNLGLTDGSLYMRAELTGPTLTILDDEVFDSLSSSVIMELGSNGLRPDGSRFTGFSSTMDLGLADIEFGGDITGIGDVAFGIGGNLAGTLEAGVINGQLAYNGRLSGSGMISVDLPGSGADFDVSTEFDVSLSDAIDSFTIPLPTIDIGLVSVELPDIQVRLSRNGAGLEAGRLRVEGIAVTVIAETLRDLYGHSASAVAATLVQAEFTVEEVGEALQTAFALTAEGVASVMADLRFEVTDIGDAISSTFGSTATQVAGILRDLEYGATEIGAVLLNTFDLSPSEIAGTLLDAGLDVRDAANAVRGAANQTAQQTAAILRDLNLSLDEIGQALRDAFDLSAGQAAEVLAGIGLDPSEIADVVSDEFFQTVDATTILLRDLEETVENVASALQDVFSLGPDDVAAALATAGFSVDEVAAGLSVIGSTTQQIASTLVNVLQVPFEQVGQLLNDIGATAQDVSAVLVGLGAPLNSVSNVLQSVYGQTLSQLGQTLRNIGTSINSVRSVLTTQLGSNLSSLPDLLLDAGFSPNEIAANLGAGFVGDLVDAFRRRVSANVTSIGNILLSAGFTGGHIVSGFFQNGISPLSSTLFLRSLSFNPRQIGSTLTTFGYQAVDVVAGMRGFYTEFQVVDMLRFGLGEVRTFNIVPWMISGGFNVQNITTAMRNIGFTAISIAQPLNQVHGFGDQLIATFLANAGYSVDEIRGALENVFGFVGSFFNDLADEISSGFCGVFGC